MRIALLLAVILATLALALSASVQRVTDELAPLIGRAQTSQQAPQAPR